MGRDTSHRGRRARSPVQRFRSERCDRRYVGFGTPEPRRPHAGGVHPPNDDGGGGPGRGRTLAAFTGKPMTVLLATAVDSAGELTQRAQGVLRESGWFLRCEGEADVE